MSELGAETVATTVEYPATMRARLKKIAAAQHRSLTGQIRAILEECLATHSDAGLSTEVYEPPASNAATMAARTERASNG